MADSTTTEPSVYPPDRHGTMSNRDGGMTEFEKDVRKIMEELGDLLVSKHHDYGPKNISASPGGAINGLTVRMWDKMARIVNLVYIRKSVTNNEPLEDSFKDIANYGVIALMVQRGKWPTE